MSATPAELAVRMLRKVKVLGATETASAEDLAVAVQAVTDAHAVLNVAGLLRWTLADIPREVELAYVLIAAHLAADEFVVPKEPGWMVSGVGMVQQYVHLPLPAAGADCGAVYADY